MTATNQHYYGGYPITQSIGAAVPNTNGMHAYQHHQTYNTNQQQQHLHHEQQQQQHHHHHQQQQQQVQPYQHHQQVVTSSVVASNQTQLTQLNSSQRNLPANTNSSNSVSAAAAAALYNSIEASKSTKGASKARRDLINHEIAQLRELLPLPASTRQRLSQLQLMALVLVYERKSIYFNEGK